MLVGKFELGSMAMMEKVYIKIIFVLSVMTLCSTTDVVICSTNHVESGSYGMGFDTLFSSDISKQDASLQTCLVYDSNKDLLGKFEMKLITDGKAPDHIQLLIGSVLALNYTVIKVECLYSAIIWDLKPTESNERRDIIYECYPDNPHIQLLFKDVPVSTSSRKRRSLKGCSIREPWNCRYVENPQPPLKITPEDRKDLGQKCPITDKITGILMFNKDNEMDCLWCGPCQKFDNSSAKRCVFCDHGGSPIPSPSTLCSPTKRCDPSQSTVTSPPSIEPTKSNLAPPSEDIFGSTWHPISPYPEHSHSRFNEQGQDVIVTGLYVQNVTNTSAILHWCHPGYNVSLKINLTLFDNNEKESEPFMPQNLSRHRFDNLIPHTKYCFSVQAYDARFYFEPLGPPSYISFMTMQNIPHPSIFEFFSLEDGSVEVKWSLDNTWHHLNVMVEYKKVGDSLFGNISLGSCGQYSRVFSLPTNGRYYLSLHFYKDSEHGPNSKVSLVNVKRSLSCNLGECFKCAVVYVLVVVAAVSFIIYIIYIHCYCKRCQNNKGSSRNDRPSVQPNENEGLLDSISTL